MSWNYRVVKRTWKGPNGDSTGYAIHEAYYEKGAEKPHSITTAAVAPVGDTVEELKKDMERMLTALDKEVLTYETFDRPEEKDPPT